MLKIIFLLLPLIIFPVYSINNNYTITQYTPQNTHLAYNSVCDIAIDKDGYKWLATNSGIVKFDGPGYTVFNNDNSDLSTNSTESIAIDKNNIKWIATFGDGLIKYNDTTWTNYLNETSDQISNYIRVVKVDSENNKWIGASRGLCKFNDSTFKYFSEFTDKDVSDISFDSSGNIWICTFNHGLYRINKEGNISDSFNVSNSEISTNELNKMVIDKSNNKWIATHYSGLIKFNGSQWFSFDTTNSALQTNWIKDIAVDSLNNILFGALNFGLVIYDGTSMTFHNSETGIPLHSDQIDAIAFSDNGETWLGGNQGVTNFNGTNSIAYSTEDNSLRHDDIYDIVQDFEGVFWFGTNHGVSTFDGNSWYTYHTSNSDLINNDVFDMAVDSSGALWLGTYRGINRILNDVWTSYNRLNVEEMLDDNITSVHVDKNNVKWFGTLDGGLLKYNDTTWQRFDTINSGICNNWITSISSDKSNTIWVGTRWGELSEFNGVDWISYSSTDIPGFSNMSVIHDSYIDSKSNKKYFATTAGVLTYDDNDWNLIQPKQDPWASNICYAINKDHEGTLWCSFKSTSINTPGIEYHDTANLYLINDNLIETISVPHYLSTPHDSIMTIFIEDTSTVWLGTLEEGVFKIKINKGVPIIESHSAGNYNKLTNFFVTQNNNNLIVNFTAPKGKNIDLNIFNSRGQKLKSLFNGISTTRSQSINLNKNNLANGLYFLNLKAGKDNITKKLHINY